ncbi:MAG: hypothetical protein QM756_26415 [Polyangiaceae bacterium]
MSQWVRRARSLLLVAALAVLALGVLALRTARSGQAALAESERAFDQGEVRESVRWAGRAATLSVPGADYVELAYRRLVIVARGAEAAGRLHLAAFAWNTVRGAAIDSATPGFGSRPELELANQNLARLASRLANGGTDDPAAERELTRTLERPAGPSEEGLWLVALGTLFVLGGLLWSALRGLRGDGRADLKRLALGGLLLVLGAACWTAATYRA